VLAGERSWMVFDLVTLQAMLAHRSGNWFGRMRWELHRTRDNPEIANAVFAHEIGSAAGEALSLQRLAEVHLAEGFGEVARGLLREALALARGSLLAKHLLHRVFGTMIVAAVDAFEIQAILDRAESTAGWDDHCAFCSIMFSVPASIACAQAGDLRNAQRLLGLAERSAVLWEGTILGGGYRRSASHNRGRERRSRDSPGADAHRR
jgi:hypothetical protein